MLFSPPSSKSKRGVSARGESSAGETVRGSERKGGEHEGKENFGGHGSPVLRGMAVGDLDEGGMVGRFDKGSGRKETEDGSRDSAALKVSLRSFP